MVNTVALKKENILRQRTDDFRQYIPRGQEARALVESHLSSTQSGSAITTQITKLFQPSTLSVVIKVHVQGEVQPAVLKLFDNRFAPDLREHHKAGAWSEELEVEYHTFLRSEDGQKFCEWLEEDEEEDELEEETELVDWTAC